MPLRPLSSVRTPMLAAVPLLALMLLPVPAFAQSLSINLGSGAAAGNGSVTTSVVGLIAITTILSVAPGILVVGTAFTRLVVVLSLLRTGMGLQQSPPNTVIVSLALFLTGLVMAPTFQAAYTDAAKPLMDGSITEEQAADRVIVPFRHFMEINVRDQDIALFMDLAHWKPPARTPGDDLPAQDRPNANAPAATPMQRARTEMPLFVLAPAFLISELSRAFQIGFLLFLPFLVIDMVVSSILMGMGMMMLPPVTISLPFKLIFFVLVNGWELIAGSLVRSFAS